MLLPANDFVGNSRFAIDTNVPSIDNTVVMQYVEYKHLLMIVR